MKKNLMDSKSILTGYITTLVDEHSFRLKGTGPTESHLGCDFYPDEQYILCYTPKKYIKKILNSYDQTYGKWPKAAHSPLINSEHPELDTSLRVTQREWLEDLPITY